jgi:hypothetical protein
MTRQSGILFSFILSVVVVGFSSLAMAGQPLFYSLPPKGKQIALDEALALSLIAEHVRNADELASRLLPRINRSTGSAGTIGRFFRTESTLDFDGDSRLLQSEAATALTQSTLLGWGVENRVSDEDYAAAQRAARSVVTLWNDNSPDQYRFHLKLILKTLHETATVDMAAFKAKWGVGYADVL